MPATDAPIFPPPAPRARPLSHRLVLPLLLLLIAGGVASPFVVNALKHRQLAANETATLELIKAYVQAQERRRAEAGPAGEYARRFDQLALPAPFPDIDEPNAAPLHGYRFRILTTTNDGEWLDARGRMTGGFGLLAVPADYMVSGRDTFLAAGSSIYCVDMGIPTPQATRELRSFGLPPKARKISGE